MLVLQVRCQISCELFDQVFAQRDSLLQDIFVPVKQRISLEFSLDYSRLSVRIFCESNGSNFPPKSFTEFQYDCSMFSRE